MERSVAKIVEEAFQLQAKRSLAKPDNEQYQTFKAKFTVAAEVCGDIGGEELLELISLAAHAQEGFHLADDCYIYIEHVKGQFKDFRYP